MPAVHSILFISYQAAVAVFQGGKQSYAALATVGLVQDDSSDVSVCAVSGQDPWLTTVAASVESFSGCHKLDATGVALLSERGAVCISFSDPAKVQGFVDAFESARAACVPKAADAGASCDLADSAFLSLIASELAESRDLHASTGEGEGDSDWQIVDADVEL